jgi:hypothetical protein
LRERVQMPGSYIGREDRLLHRFVIAPLITRQRQEQVAREDQA